MMLKMISEMARHARHEHGVSSVKSCPSLQTSPAQINQQPSLSTDSATFSDDSRGLGRLVIGAGHGMQGSFDGDLTAHRI